MENVKKVDVISLPKKKFEAAFLLSLIAICISILSVFLTYSSTISPADINIPPFAGYGIQNKIDEWSSDHLILLLDFVNNGSRSALIRQPKLTLKENGGESLTFWIMGEYEKFSTLGSSDTPKLTQSFLIPGHSVSTHIVIFHIENWFDDSSSGNFNFYFKPNKIYNVDLEYVDKDNNKCIQQNIGIVDTHDANVAVGQLMFWPVDIHEGAH